MTWLVGLVPLAAIGAIVIVASRRASRRYAPLVVVLGWLAALGTWLGGSAASSRIATGALAIGLTGFWLVDRGIPGNRRRPTWLTLGGAALVLLSIAVSVVLGRLFGLAAS